MLTLTVAFGDEVVINTPAGNVRVLVGGAKRDRRRISIDAPKDWHITRRGRFERRAMPSVAPLPTSRRS